MSLPSGSFHKPLILLHQRTDSWKLQSQKTNQYDHMDHSLVYSTKLRAMLCRATQDGQVMVKNSDKMWSAGGVKGKLCQYSSRENPWTWTCTIWKGKKIWYWKMNLPGGKMSNMLLRKSRGQLLIASEKWSGWAKMEMTLSYACVWWWKLSLML